MIDLELKRREKEEIVIRWTKNLHILERNSTMMLLSETADGFRLNRFGLKKRVPMLIHFKAVGMDEAGEGVC